MVIRTANTVDQDSLFHDFKAHKNYLLKLNYY